MAKANKETVHHLANLLESNGLESADASVLLESMGIDILDMQLEIDVRKEETKSFNKWLEERLSKANWRGFNIRNAVRRLSH